MNILIGFFLVLHVIVTLLLIMIVLMQRPRSEGLGTAFGSGVTDTLFGSSTGNVLTKITTWLGTMFFIITLTLAYLYSHAGGASSNLGKKLQSTVAPALTSTNAPAALPLPTPAPVPPPSTTPVEDPEPAAPAKIKPTAPAKK